MGDSGPQLADPAAAPLGDLVKGRLRVTQTQLAVLVQTEREQPAVVCGRASRVSLGIKKTLGRASWQANEGYFPCQKHDGQVLLLNFEILSPCPPKFQ